MRTVLLVSVLFAAFVCHAVPRHTRGRAMIERVIAETGGGYFPVLVKLKDGTLGAVVRGGAPHLGRAGRLDWIASRDGGRTWTRPAIVVDSAWDDRNPAVGVMRDGAIVVAYGEASTYNAKGEFDLSAGAYTPKVVRSTDGGRTWSAPVIVDARPIRNASPYGRIVTLDDGTALMSVYGIPSESLAVLRSTDGGRTWGDLTVLPGHDETALLPCPNGRILAFTRPDGSTTHGLEISESLDRGRTWSTPVRMLQPNQWPHDVCRLRNGHLLLTHGNRIGPFGVGALLSRDDGKTWSPVPRGLLADDAQSGDCGYPSTVQLDDETIVTLFYAAGTRSMPGVEQAIALRYREEALMEPAPPGFQVISRGETAGPYQAFPDACRLRNGDIAAVFYAGYEHVSLPNAEWPKGGRICIVRSRDEGRTWSKPEALYDDEHDNRDPHITQLKDGTAVCTFFSLKRGPSGGYLPVTGAQMVRSTDGGRTWSTQARQVAPINWYCSAPVRQMPDGTCLLGVYFADDKRAFGGVIRSTDSGETWSDPIPIGDKDGVRLDAETDVVLLPDGVLSAALRGDGKVHMHYATSTDLGLTWSRVHDIGFLGHCPHLTRLRTGEVLLAVRHPQTGLYISRDGCRTWDGPTIIDDVGGAYPATVPLKDGTVLVAYYTEGKGSEVRAKRFRVLRNGVEFLPL